MDKRIVDFITALRAAGVRISVAESADALRAIEQVGLDAKEFFRAALQTTLVKEPQDIPSFQQLFPLYFSGAQQPPMQQPGGDGSLSEAEREKLEQMLQQMLENMTPQQLAELFAAMMRGQRPSDQQLQGMLAQIPPPHMTNPMYQEWMARQTLRELKFNQLDRMLRELLEKLREQGMSEAALQAIEEAARQNQAALAEQISQQVAEQMIAQGQGENRQPRPQNQLLDRPFEYLTEREAEDMRAVVARLAARLRSRMALRQRRGKHGTLDAKGTIRTNLRFGGVPIVVRHRRRHLKPRLVVICDRSVSTERVVRFVLQLIYTLQDQISRTRSFAFIDTIYDISTYFAESRPEQAIDTILEQIRPIRSYSTDLGRSLEAFLNTYGSCLDHRTTVIILGDGRNNENNPRVELLATIKRRSRKLIWFNTEPREMWGKYDPGSLSSDMLEYAPCCDAVHEVRTMRQLAEAVDGLFVRG